MTENSDTLQQLLDQAKQQQMFLEMFVRSWVDDYRSGGGSICCGKGCRNCCSLAVHTGFAEALAVARHLDEEQGRAVERYATTLRDLVQGIQQLPQYLRLHRDSMGFCPLLNAEGACSVYPVRPLTCRSLISTRDSVWCGADFARIAPEEREAFLAGLDQKVVSFPSHYVAVLQESGKELEEAGAQQMRSLLGFSLYGNLGVLVHLCRAHDLAGAALQGRAQAERVIAEAGFDHPLLVTQSHQTTQTPADFPCR
ncbi:YkgJ family cysteine cluster protein [Geomonas oryzisoli]|uniref:YkgJ family cysteine cluster protein n=1 Tax=Geomonas oryzisoli TaxID=2847992 RepID=A0ABX8JC28_9BACT|nr:YkgJ family cysteine cluster protein [Geomonas oryzisoli]QWV94691.1 YkgJ family cysteine cluster protein [Geomonas oryzisoli]